MEMPERSRGMIRPITAKFDANGSEDTFADVTGLVCGAQVSRPASDPIMPYATIPRGSRELYQNLCTEENGFHFVEEVK